MTKKLSREDMVSDALKWVKQNHGVQLESGVKKTYSSPRVSSEIDDCSMPMTFDQYNFCSLGCLYCFAYFFKISNPTLKGKEIPLKAVNHKKMIAALEGNPRTVRDRILYENFYKQKFLLHWGGLADPFCSFEAKNFRGYRIIKALGELNYPTLFSFKGPAINHPKYERLFAKYAKQKNFAFQISIVTNDDKMSRMVEIGVPSTTERLATLKRLSDMGYWTILRLRPFLMGVTTVGLYELLCRAKEAGAKGVSCEWFALELRGRTEALMQRYEWLGEQMGVQKGILEYYKKLSPSERGGYRRLNRAVKEPYAKMIYKFCIENDMVCGFSDPDYKELNTSGSCCGMPDKFEANPLLENWSKSQWTYHLKEARKAYHKTGELRELEFNTVYDSECLPYLDDTRLANDHVSCVGLPADIRNVLTQKNMIQRAWNNLNSPKNPRNYFHGKVEPNGLDEHGNFKYVYSPTEYEERWKNENIDMTF